MASIKNKRGFGVTDFVFGLVGLFVLILVLVILLAAQKGGISDPKMISDALTSTSVKIMKDLQPNQTNSPIINIVYSFMSFIVYSGIEVAKAAVNYGLANPSWLNPQLILWLIILSLAMPVVWYGFLIITAIVLIVREWYLNKKERKRYEKIQTENK